MQEGAEIVRRVWRAAQLRRLPLWIVGALPWLVIRSGPGLVAWSAFCAWDWAVLRRRVAIEWTSWVDGAVPEMEDSSALLAHAPTPVAQLQQRRLLARIDASVSTPQLRAMARGRIKAGAPWLLGSVLAAAGVWFAGAAAPQASAVAQNRPKPVLATLATNQVIVRTAPPNYTGVAPVETTPQDLQVPEQTLVMWCVMDPTSPEETIEASNGQVFKPGRECARWTATESVFWRWRGKRYTIKVIPDQPPEITITAPTQMVQELLDTATGAAMGVQIRDDYAIRQATLHMTLARGSGENIRFTDREMPLPAGPDPKQRNWSRQWTLSELGMEPGDELYFFVRAVDNAARPHAVQSPTYTLRLPAPVEEAEEDTAAMPMLVKPQSLRSQRQIIIDTEQLVADMRSTKIGADAVRERSERIAADQGALRRRYGQFLGEESSLFADGEEHSEDDGHDHGGEKGGTQDILHTYGHAHDEAENATLYDEDTKKVLRRALTAMWDAEKALRALSPKVALPPEHKALDAIKELQQAERVYLHKTAFTPPPIKEEKRMTGDMDGTASYRRAQGGSEERVPEDVRLLVQALSSDGPLPALWTRSAHDWVRTHIKDDEQRLAAQGAIQDVADGRAASRPVLRAWLRAGAGQGKVLLQAQSKVETPFVRAWREGAPK
ncbi:DUF4175 domain-containing protein [Massilia sp. G4R7]|uniref:DUF4175 domain-containing protein n=1 Tax=Massilia phyllostachyos TaxID=2898585 RepID=A0ABS8Q7H9_9BURK|nr:DUF4175 domain-containing protein [Massilia phyllostachyos]MCD2516916.1 DUF4175 domain-containing protein [Massilia phyllostachyos]